jgi:phage gpG-like protein
MKPNQFYKQLRAKLPRLKQQILNDVIAVEATRHWAKNFQQRGFIDNGLSSWQPRKYNEPGKPNRALLVKTGRLRRAALNPTVSNNSVDFTFPEGYMRIHNEGGTITQTVTAAQRRFFWAMFRKSGDTMWKSAALSKTLTIRIPQRKFIGYSALLKRRIDIKCQDLLNRQLNNL